MAARRRYKAYTFTPSQGGRLMASVSKDTVGVKNYLTKRDFRRVLDREQRREGYDYFAPKDILFTKQYSQYPWGEGGESKTAEINLIHMAIRPNGDKAVIVGTTGGYLYRYEGTDALRYFTDTRDNDHDAIYTEESNLWGSELVSGTYTSVGTKLLTVEEGEDYYYTEDANETSLVNGTETLTDSGYFKAQSNVVTINGIGSSTVTASVKKRDASKYYAQSVPSEWRTIHTPDNESKNRLRWEAINVNGYAVFNNGADIPLVYRTEWDVARPIYALREAGVARVGTISELSGVLICGDVSQMKKDDIKTQMESSDPYGYYDKSVDRIGYRVLFSDIDDPTSFGATAKATIFEGSRVMAWRWVPLSIGHDEITITGAGAGAGNLTANIVGTYTKAASSFRVLAPSFKGQYTQGDYSKGVKHKDAGDNEFEGIKIYEGLTRAFEVGEIIHFKNGSAFQFTSNAAAADMTIYGLLLGDAPNDEQGDAATNYVKLDEFAAYSTVDTEVAKSGAFSGTAGFDDLQDDGSAVLKMAKLQNVLVIYKETSIFIAEYTGDTASPFRFNYVKTPASKALKYRHTVANVEGMAHIYAGDSAFYTFDLASRKPKELPDFKNADALFFDNATSANTENIYAADNQITKEIWFVTNGSSSDKALCFDYLFNTLSTTSANITSASTIQKPGTEEDWFVMGTSGGVVLVYGLTHESFGRWAGKTYFYRRGNKNYSTTEDNYASVIESGAENFGDGFNEKDLRSYVLHLAHASDSPATTLDISGYHNVGDIVSGDTDNVLETRVFDDPDTKNLLPLFYKQHYFQDKITISTGNAQVAGKTYEVAGVDSRSFVRTDDA
tara:strand:- start:140 stop:2662 length:2523 start_codon:yes stop_codon:yes gene_type:complete